MSEIMILAKAVLQIFGLNNINLVIEIIYIQKYTLSCKTGSDSKRNAYKKVISCKFCEEYTVKIL